MSYPVDIEDQHHQDEDPVILNIGGVKYEVMPSTLAQYPDTLLGNIFNPNNKHLRKTDKKGEYFFDRNGRLFEFILNYYRTGKLVIPPDFPKEIILDEIRYFKIDYKPDGVTNEEDEDEKILRQPKDQIYQYASSLIHSSSRKDIKRGLKFLTKLREAEPNSYLYRYSYSFACYRLGENAKGIQSLEDILTTDQHNPQAKSLLTLFNDVRLNNTRNGIIALCLAGIGIYGFIKIRKWYNIAKLVEFGKALPETLSKAASNAGPIGSVSTIISTETIPSSASSAIGTVSSSIPSSIAKPTSLHTIYEGAKVAADATVKSLNQSNIQAIPADQFNNVMSNNVFKK
ncbi:hypothetical protein DICPUDRAFT_147946 [Dictyostelium purpureum]|uniref:BTB domain-containing protein n=1 Tax=Dictyostelium purpureum TaxID=5786 RepID=F0Z9U5_DICPU|nr:uncharacterized protein DICPUDRAFT_147946 [Dictyostelium purpureum]EGC39301.1 hypothetical protein DICPUDRAFT_147946 [Dictyostelium purpureum]|eukprot:XP_003284205.1 hypothetical protein DICPUDRAFT_147946 [Dictyostelium purpureum]